MIKFVARNVAALDVQPMDTGRGTALVTTAEQTVLDLAHDPRLGNAGADAKDAIRMLWPRCDQEKLRALAGAQRLKAALERARSLAEES